MGVLNWERRKKKLEAVTDIRKLGIQKWKGK